MPLAYELTIEQKEIIDGVLWSAETKFLCHEDINGNWYIMDFLNDYPLIQASEYAWILELPVKYFEPKITDLPF